MKVTTSRNSDAVSIHLEGKLVIGQLDEFYAELVTQSKNQENVIVDFSGVDRVDMAGIQLLISAKKTFKSAKIGLSYQNHPSKLIDYLAWFGLIGVFKDKIIVTDKIKRALPLDIINKKTGKNANG